MMLFATAAIAGSSGPPAIVFVLVLALALAGLAFLGVRRHGQRAAKASGVVRGDFQIFVLEALANAAKLDGRFAAAERDAISAALRELDGGDVEQGKIERALEAASLTREELLAYVEETGRSISHPQKVQFLKALLAVFVSDGRFDETEHQVLVAYTAALGFDRATAVQKLRGLISDMARDRIT